MWSVSGLPVHVLLVHGIVVLVPMTAALVIVCALWPAARRRFIWPTAALAVLVTVLTPVTAEAGEWLQQRLGSTPAIEKHVRLGGQMLYFVVPLLIAAALLALVHTREGRGKPIGRAVLVAVAVLAVAAGAAATVQTYRVGDSGAHAVWNGVVS
ncbi:hypothetical protein OHB26_23220 [Nocardia sp. NBC_01503]|uniref:DUF2231 domain-containing protein n=1 Tax=Nocardia sp. NBC_01503 TaxID=2975997 RepID=UPI002E7B0BA9|nr:DUF2231 domain-containing protein [Nocardia sp. NBC_01503]WTL29869.1 hypothetical protein OHB26_23220 [Nocardia sp. NBC_01503]